MAVWMIVFLTCCVFLAFRVRCPCSPKETERRRNPIGHAYLTYLIREQELTQEL